MANSNNSGFFNVLFSNNKIISYKDSIEKNISEELLTIRTLVIVGQPGREAVAYAQLEKILSACTLQQKDYMVASQPENWALYRRYDNIKEVLLFGISEEALDIKVHFAENQINKFDGRVWIKTMTISEIMDNQSVKNTLWQNALKPHFVA